MKMMARKRAATSSKVLIALLLGGLLSGCYRLLPSSGGGQASFDGSREVRPSSIALPEGYFVEAVATGLTFPTGVAFDEQGGVYVTEAGYSYGDVFRPPALLRVDGGEVDTVLRGARSTGPWNGVTYHDGDFYIAEGGHLVGGRIVRADPEAGARTVLVDDLPSLGDHHTNGPVVGPNGWVYFAQGTATNSAVVGKDNFRYGWLKRYPDFHDTPCCDVTLTGRNYRTGNPLTRDPDDAEVTGAYVPFGTRTEEGQVVRGEVPCSGAIMRVRPQGGEPQLVAWGFRNPFGLAFSPGGELYVTENGYDVRGSRPVWGAGDFLWAVEEGTWYGWPDFVGGVPVSEFDPPGEDAPAPVLAGYPNEPPRPSALLGVHSSSNGFDFSHSSAFGFEGDAFIAQFGDMAPTVGKVLAPVGYQIVRVEPREGIVHGFAGNKGDKNGPASKMGGGGFERPVAARFSPDGSALYVVDFGVMTMSEQGPKPRPGTGVLWRITREETP